MEGSIVRSHKKQIIYYTPKANFRNDLTLATWYLLETESDQNKAWDTWKQIFMQVADSHAPLKTTRVRGNFGPWITPNLKNLFQRNKLKKLASRSQNHTDWNNLVNYTLKAEIARVEYYNNCFKENSPNIKNT